MSLAGELVDLIAADPVALERLRELVGNLRTDPPADSRAPAFTVATLAGELGRSERSIRAAIARGELQAVKRGRGWVISADAVADWARAKPSHASDGFPRQPSRRRPGPRSGAGPMARALTKRLG